MNITTMTREIAREIDREAEAALRSVAEKFGLSVVPKGGSFSSTGFVAKFEFAVTTNRGDSMPRPIPVQEVDFLAMAIFHGFEADDLGKTFVYRGASYTIAGYKRWAPKFPIAAISADGKRFKFPIAAVLAALGRDPH